MRETSPAEKRKGTSATGRGRRNFSSTGGGNSFRSLSGPRRGLILEHKHRRRKHRGHGHALESDAGSHHPLRDFLVALFLESFFFSGSRLRVRKTKKRSSLHFIPSSSSLLLHQNLPAEMQPNPRRGRRRWRACLLLEWWRKR